MRHISEAIVSKKTGIYGKKVPRSIRDLRPGCIVKMKPAKDILAKLEETWMVIGEMKAALGSVVTVVSVDYGDSTFRVETDGIELWFPFEVVEYILG
jgi:hypothetical protein